MSILGDGAGGHSSVYLVGHASVTGAHHADRGETCQDIHLVEFMEDSLLLAVADGAGSARYSREGARAVVLAITSCIKQEWAGRTTHDVRRVLIHCMDAGRTALEYCAKDYCVTPRDVACTAIVAVLHGGALWCAHVGDGGVVALVDETIMLVSAPEVNEYVNEVSFISSDHWRTALRATGPIHHVSAVAVFTDGCQRACLIRKGSRVEPLEGFFCPLFTHVSSCNGELEVNASITELLTSKPLQESSDDDKTLLVAVTRQLAGDEGALVLAGSSPGGDVSCP